MRLALLLVACMLLTGCSGGGPGPISGKVLKDGTPLSVSEKGMAQIRLVGDANTYSGKIEANGTFVIKGNDGKGVPPGTYKVAVLALDPYPTRDLLAGKFDEKHTKITRDVKSGEELVIDLSKP